MAAAVASTSLNTSMSFLMLRTPVRPATACSAASRSTPYRTVPLSQTWPSLALASTLLGTLTVCARTLFAAVVSIGSSR
jgi:hypothetical protein